MKTPKRNFSCPKKMGTWLDNLREDVATHAPVKGRNTTIDEHPGKGTVINAQAGGSPQTYHVVINGAIFTQDFLVTGAPQAG